MKASNLILKIYAEKVDGQWSLVCLDFSLAAQAESLHEAKRNLEAQIKEYLVDALHGEDKAFAHKLLSRRAPIKYYAKWWYGVAMMKLFGRKYRSNKAFREPVQMVPA